MKVMGSALMVFQSIVIGLAMPVAIVVGGYRTALVAWTAAGLIALCLLSVGALRRQCQVPGVVFLLVWVLAVRLSAKTDSV